VIQQKSAVCEAGFGFSLKEDMDVTMADNPWLRLGINKERKT
jgi:hypothetical protein